MEFKSKIKTIEWSNNVSKMVDQTLIPYEYKMVEIKSSKEMFDAISTMIVRGAPAIGIAGAHGIVLAAMEILQKTKDKEVFLTELKKHAEYLKSARPTAVNLMWAVDKQFELAKNSQSDVQGIVEELKQNAIKLANTNIRKSSN